MLSLRKSWNMGKITSKFKPKSWTILMTPRQTREESAREEIVMHPRNLRYFTKIVFLLCLCVVIASKCQVHIQRRWLKEKGGKAKKCFFFFSFLKALKSRKKSSIFLSSSSPASVIKIFVCSGVILRFLLKERRRGPFFTTKKRKKSTPRSSASFF